MYCDQAMCVEAFCALRSVILQCCALNPLQCSVCVFVLQDLGCVEPLDREELQEGVSTANENAQCSHASALHNTPIHPN